MKVKFKLDFKKHILMNLPYFALAYVTNKLCALARAQPEGDTLDRLFAALIDFGSAFKNPFPSLHITDFLVGAAAGFGFWFIMYQKRKNAKKFREGKEYGSARWTMTPTKTLSLPRPRG